MGEGNEATVTSAEKDQKKKRCSGEIARELQSLLQDDIGIDVLTNLLWHYMEKGTTRDDLVEHLKEFLGQQTTVFVNWLCTEFAAPLSELGIRIAGGGGERRDGMQGGGGPGGEAGGRRETTPGRDGGDPWYMRADRRGEYEGGDRERTRSPRDKERERGRREGDLRRSSGRDSTRRRGGRSDRAERGVFGRAQRGEIEEKRPRMLSQALSHVVANEKGGGPRRPRPRSRDRSERSRSKDRLRNDGGCLGRGERKGNVPSSGVDGIEDEEMLDSKGRAILRPNPMYGSQSGMRSAEYFTPADAIRPSSPPARTLIYEGSQGSSGPGSDPSGAPAPVGSEGGGDWGGGGHTHSPSVCNPMTEGGGHPRWGAGAGGAQFKQGVPAAASGGVMGGPRHPHHMFPSNGGGQGGGGTTMFSGYTGTGPVGGGGMSVVAGSGNTGVPPGIAVQRPQRHMNISYVPPPPEQPPPYHPSAHLPPTAAQPLSHPPQVLPQPAPSHGGAGMGAGVPVSGQVRSGPPYANPSILSVGGDAPAKMRKRCETFPNCPFGDQCRYIHPTEQCTKWPHCSFGRRCFYLHPDVPCKFGLNCHNQTCNYEHPEGWDDQLRSGRAGPGPDGLFRNLTYRPVVEGEGDEGMPDVAGKREAVDGEAGGEGEGGDMGEGGGDAGRMIKPELDRDEEIKHLSGTLPSTPPSALGDPTE
eukprot:GHVN01024165.1.p1 GENE.GHVN01024165.1~~GHVN01024165.1.p1  ORF type:complete len:696 (-),score=149.63 GHVN01024165.1:126-2213(-)